MAKNLNMTWLNARLKKNKLSKHIKAIIMLYRNV